MNRAQDKKRISNATLGLLLAIFITLASYFAFTKAIPFTGGTEYKAVFNSAQNLRVNSPVRIAGVNVGTVKSVEPLAPGEAGTEDGQGGAMVTLEFDDDGLPLKQDATFKLRPRLFLEGNLFVEVRPGSPSAPEQDPGQAFAPNQTSNTVQLDQIFTNSLQKDVRTDLQVLLDEFGIALIDEGGAESFRTLYKTAKGNFKNTSQVNEATLGQNEGDLSSLIKNLDKVIAGLGKNERALQDTVTNLATVTGSFAAEDQALEQAIVELPQVIDAGVPAFASLNAALPSLRAFAREALPGVRTAPDTLDVATPFVVQLRKLSTNRELRGLANDLRPAVPNLASLNAKTPAFLEQGRALSSCFNNVIIPWSLDQVDGGPGYPHETDDPVYKETAYGLAGISGESRSHDANGPYIRIAGGGGTNTVSVTAASGEQLAGVSQFPIQGTVPATDSSAKTPFEPEEPCENQETPDLRSAVGAGPTNTSSTADPNDNPFVEAGGNVLQGLLDAKVARQNGDSDARSLKREALKDLKRYYNGKIDLGGGE